jgi:hypothetical protein
MPAALNKRSVGILRGFGVLGLLIGGLFFLVGGLRATQGHVQATKWPAVEARVDHCWIHTYYHRRSHVPGSQNQARCAFQYEVAGFAYQETKDAGSSVFYSNKEVVLVRPKVTLSMLNSWIALHPNGSIMSIHYDPADPRQISLAGADDDIQENTAEIQLKISVTLLSVSLAVLFTSFAIGRKNAMADAGALDKSATGQTP